MTTENKSDPKETHSLAFPTNTVFAVFPSAPDAKKAMDRLSSAGVAGRNVRIFDGDEGAQALDPASNGGGLLRGLAKELSDVTTYLERYADSCRQGNAVATVPFGDDEERQTITSLLLVSGAKEVRYAPGWTMTEVVQQPSKS